MILDCLQERQQVEEVKDHFSVHGSYDLIIVGSGNFETLCHLLPQINILARRQKFSLEIWWFLRLVISLLLHMQCLVTCDAARNPNLSKFGEKIVTGNDQLANHWNYVAISNRNFRGLAASGYKRIQNLHSDHHRPPESTNKLTLPNLVFKTVTSQNGLQSQ